MEKTVSHTVRNNSGQTFKTDQLSIALDCRGDNAYTKLSYPVKYGIFSRLETRDHLFEFNLNHEIRHAKAKTRDWPHPSEWLKRTLGNDWVYYSSGGYAGVYEAIGEYYLPNFTYPTNAVIGGKPFNEPPVETIVNHWPDLLAKIPSTGLPDRFTNWLNRVKQIDAGTLKKKADRLFGINGTRVTVLPPDARHVDYNVIPLTISDGCLYKCRFCRIKNQKPFSARSHADISGQIRELKDLLGDDLINYNALFLGEHDALNSPENLILDTIQEAVREFNFKGSYMKGGYLFMFASADALIDKKTAFFDRLNRLDMTLFINVGLESSDPETLDRIGKPTPPEKIRVAFERGKAVNAGFSNIEVSFNFIMDDTLASGHHDSMLRLIRGSVSRPVSKGTVYLSPLRFDRPSRQVLYDFYKIKSLSRFPAFLYIIQRL